ncbi:MAG: chorismate synthase [Bacteroidales bacterium]|nr:chorismate synthase [Bacteroidales bacterium]MBN2761923.1 chorismate synthase [Bacteroidales bacterium]
MLGCTYGTLFKTTVAGGSYQEGLSINMQGVPPGYLFSEEEIYVELMLRKPGQGELTSPRREADVPIIYSGVNAADTMPGFKNAGYTNGTPLVILIPNVDRHFEHIEQYQLTNRTPRPGHASYASYQKYGSWDDSIGAGFFSGRYTSSIVAAGCIAKRILKDHGIEVVAFVREAAGIRMGDMPVDEIKKKAAAYREVRKHYDPIYLDIFASGKMKSSMRFFEKAAILAELEKRIPDIKKPVYNEQEIREKYGINPKLFCPDAEVADAMYAEILRIMQEGDSSGGLVEVVVTGVPAGMGEPVFNKLDGELGRLMSIGTVKAVEIGVGLKAATLKGSESNDAMRVENGKVVFTSNNAGGITGGLTTGQDIIARVAVKPTPTIAKPQLTIDKVSLENKELAAVTRRDPTIVARMWPVVEAYTSLIILDAYMQHVAYQAMKRKG